MKDHAYRIIRTIAPAMMLGIVVTAYYKIMTNSAKEIDIILGS
jgi:hypothetical protein